MSKSSEAVIEKPNPHISIQGLEKGRGTIRYERVSELQLTMTALV